MSRNRTDMCLRARRRFDESPQTDDYKQLYLQTKANVQLFIRQVEQELIQIMSRHQTEKENLLKDNQMLREQLDQTRFRDKGHLSANKWNFDVNIKAFEDCALSDISMVESKSLVCSTARKKEKPWGLIADLNGQKQTETTHPFSSRSALSSRDNIENDSDSDFSILKSRMMACRKAKREQHSIQFPREGVRDVLKKMRFKANNVTLADMMKRQSKEEKPENILGREMFVPR